MQERGKKSEFLSKKGRLGQEETVQRWELTRSQAEDHTHYSQQLEFLHKRKSVLAGFAVEWFFCCLFTYIAKQVSKSFLIRSLGVKAVGETGQKGMVFSEIQAIDLLNASHAIFFRPPVPLGKPGYSGGSPCLACKRSFPTVEMRTKSLVHPVK